MRARLQMVSALTSLPSLGDINERRRVFRQAITCLGQAQVDDGPLPLDALEPELLQAAVREALKDGLFDDIDGVGTGSASLALYELASNLPSGAERRELGKRVYLRLYGGDARSFAPVATRMALGGGKQLDNPAMRARVNLCLSMPAGSEVAADPLALALLLRPETFARWVGGPATGPLPGRRAAARLLERAAREAVNRAFRGDKRPCELFKEGRIAEVFQQLLDDREPLVWRHVAVARGYLSAFFPELREELDLLLDPGLTPTEWRRAAVSLVTTLAFDPGASLPQCLSLIDSEIAARHPGIIQTMFWGIAPVAETEPDAAERLLKALCKVPSLAIGECLTATLNEVGHANFGHRVVHQFREAINRISSNQDPILNALITALDDSISPLHVDNSQSLRHALAAAHSAYEREGAIPAFKAAQHAFQLANEHISYIEKLKGMDGLFNPETLPLLQDLDASFFEQSKISELLLLGRRPGDDALQAAPLEQIQERLTRWALQVPHSLAPNDEWTRGKAMAFQRRLLNLLHMADNEGARSESEEATGRARERIRLLSRHLFQALLSGPDASTHRLTCAALARSLDAAVREGLLDPSEVLSMVLQMSLDTHSVNAITEGCTHPHVHEALSAYGAFLATAGDDAEVPSEAVSDPSIVATRFDLLSAGLGHCGSYRSEALRRTLLAISRAVHGISQATSLTMLKPASLGDRDIFSEFDIAVSDLGALLDGAHRRVFGSAREEEESPPASIPSLAALVERAILNADKSELERNLPLAIAQLLEKIPDTLFDALGNALKHLSYLPINAPHGPKLSLAGAKRGTLPQWLLPRRTMGGFYVLRALGEGGVSSVFVGRRLEQRSDDNAEEYALKVPMYDPNTARSLSEAEFLNLFKDEAGALLALPRHPNLARFVTFDLEAKPRPLLVMELIRGQSIERLIRTRTVTTEGALRCLDGTLAGIEAMHTSGVAHLDIKPSNVILRTDQTPVLVDFGLSGRQLRPGCGTLEYCAPEVLGVQMNHPGSATAADLYAFGCMAYELLTGELLFDGDDEMALMSGHVAHDGWPEPLAAMANIAAYRDISIVIAACIRREPSYRATAGQARKALLAAWPAVAALTWPLRQHLSINPSAQTA